MASKKNPYATRFSNMNNAGGNHKAQTADGILQEGQKSYKATVDQKLGTQHAENAYAKKFSHITPDLGSAKPQNPAPTNQPKKTM